MRVPSTLRWSLLALAGLAVTIAVAFAASDLASERIGLASEPIRAGESLAPAAGRSEPPGDREPSRPDRSGEGDLGTAPVTTTPAPSAQTTETSEDGEPTESGSGGGEGEDEDD
jgi:hypothetical protein